MWAKAPHRRHHIAKLTITRHHSNTPQPESPQFPTAPHIKATQTKEQHDNYAQLQLTDCTERSCCTHHSASFCSILASTTGMATAGCVLISSTIAWPDSTYRDSMALDWTMVRAEGSSRKEARSSGGSACGEEAGRDVGKRQAEMKQGA